MLFCYSDHLTTTRKNVLDNGMMIRELDSTGVSKATYLQGASGAVYRREDLANNVQNVTWYVYDGLGSVACELNPNGTVAGRRVVDAYGMTRSTAGSGGKHGFVGQLGHTTDETGLVYMRARHYDPQTGRFQSQDPAAHSKNWFVYCANDPVNKMDGNGKIFLPAVGISALLGFILSFVSAYFSGKSFAESVLAGLAGALGGALGACFGPALGGALGAAAASILGDIFSGQEINWQKAGFGAFCGGVMGGFVAKTLYNIFGNSMRNLGFVGDDVFDGTSDTAGALLGGSAGPWGNGAADQLIGMQ